MFRWLASLGSRLARWWRSWWRRSRFAGVAWVRSDEDPARQVRGRKLVLVGSREKPKWLRFACPCGCGLEIALNLMASHDPHWRVEIHPDQTLTLYPSVDSTSCGAHFWVRRNEVDWV